MVAEGLEQIGRLTNGALCFLKHVEQKAHFTQQTNFAHTCGCSVLERQVAYQRREVHDLK